MRLLYIFLITSILSSCIKKDKENINTTKVISSTKVKKEISKVKSKFILTEKNSMDFFLEYDKIHKENVVELDTDMGKIEITLFNETKFHRSNFLYLSKLNYFKSTQFYRVINNFIIQGGNSDNRKIWKKRKSIGKYLLPVDNNHGFKHSRGMVSMPSSIIKNPHKLASPYEFFIVQSKSGAHFLDGDYTIFGKVSKGMDVVDKIAAVDTDDLDWPISNIFINNVKVLR
ncbi:peptidylprolyl isomerase [Flavobacteriaceae bacterium]|jgi:peptidyl-prolyl cis-trans isomerase A (cyclophilin A)|nr:peptidylprolyl isomerase [Bacteroidota bacterium]MDB4196176.1 peptidylprolyl isomerase [Flavobacteriaceae bacterium]MDC0552050.1 peptidylprolyl isomerase [Flavobacteriaceae bacterium]MDC0622870.1 peptidylprolyl isomerase [Flavobacteriaceae bacterium]|tara:strand:+ start:34 stop:720 length:687 start_codon:yes stop_codon:yes gene_type:complete